MGHLLVRSFLSACFLVATGTGFVLSWLLAGVLKDVLRQRKLSSWTMLSRMALLEALLALILFGIEVGALALWHMWN